MGMNESTGTEALADRTWYSISVEETAALLDASTDGLEEREAVRRLALYGPNEVEEEKERPWPLVLLRQFADPLIYILLIAAVVTFILGDITDTGVIIAVVLLNAIIGFWQELRARQAIRALAGMSAPRADVLRDGRTANVQSSRLVPGDVVLLSSGVNVPADIRLIRTQELEVDESALTGESVAVYKTNDVLSGGRLVPGDQRNIAFAGTTVTRGRGRGIVVRTGERTELGRIATTMRELGTVSTPLQEKMKQFGRRLGVVILVLAIIVILLGLLQDMSLKEIFLAAVAMAVSEVPEGLPVVLTLTFAIGVRHMARRNAIVRSLPAVETLGSTTVIGSDKTGTLTRNEMTVRRIVAGGRQYSTTGAGYGGEGEIVGEDGPVDARRHEPLYQTILAGILANEADPRVVAEPQPVGDPTELALHAVAAKGGLDAFALRSACLESDIIPFEPEQRFMATLNSGPDGTHIFMKGAPEVVLARCDRQLTDTGEEPLQAEKIVAEAERMGADGLRVLATARRAYSESRLEASALDDGFVLLGLQGMEDPVRPEAIAGIRDAHDAGIRVLMLTGDHLHTATAVGRQLGLDTANQGAIEGRDLEQLTREELDGIVGKVNIYARVAPEHKLLIVERLKAMGEVVAVTGDGVNDGPALRSAHLGIAMGKSGTDVAREASDLVLTDDNFATITAAIEEGRVVFLNIRKVAFFLLSTAVGEVITLIVALSLGWPLPFVAAQLLWINLVTNGLQDVALAFEPGEPGLLKQPPRRRDEGILTSRLLQRLGSVGIVLAAGTLAMFWWTLNETGDIELARTVAVTQMVVFQFFHVFNCRSLDRSIFSIPFFSNRLLFLSIVAAALAHVAVLYVPFMQHVFRTVPLNPTHWIYILLIGTFVIVGGELDKWWNRRKATPLG